MIGHLIKAVAGAALLAASGAIITGKVTDADQNARLSRLEDLNNSVDRLSDKLDHTDRQLERLQGQLEGERVVPRDQHPS